VNDIHDETSACTMTCRSSASTRLANDDGESFCAPTSPDALLASTSVTLRGQPVYAYIVTTIKTTSDYQLCQTGSAPNFAGGRITLCSCKHKDRATFQPSNDPQDPWKNVWVAGLTSISADPSRSLAYLICVERSFLSQRELWHALPNRCRQAKCASNSKRGDLYRPRAAAANEPYRPAHYHRPMSGHVHSSYKHPNSWYHDVMQWGRRSRPHRLLLGQRLQSYRWTHVEMILKLNVIGHSAHHCLFPSLNEFIANLQQFEP